MMNETTSYRAAADDVRRALAAHVRRAVQEANGTERFVHVEHPLPGVDALAWLAAQRAYPQHYWSARGEDAAVATAGAADTCEGAPAEALAALRKRLECCGAARYYGGMRFDAARPAAEAWRPFGRARFVLPRFAVQQEGAEARLTCTLVLPRDGQHVEAILAQIGRLAFPPPVARPHVRPAAQRRRDAPGREAWARRVEDVLEAIRRGALEKVVLARRATFTFDAALDPLALLGRLRRATPGCYHFMVRPEAGAAFVGASPERLFRVEEDVVESEAVAGTRPRGASAGADDALRAELLGSAKDRREHAAVREAVGRHLEALCEEVALEAAATDLALPRGRHLHARLRGTLRAGAGPLDVLRALHPTPAVGGAPRGAALRMIRQAEAFDRGWYAGPVGWVEAGAAEFAVGVRSGHVRGRRLDLYAGAGIVEGSRPASEWDEVEQKMADFAAVLDLAGSVKREA